MTYKILNGNELLIQGGLEAGFSLYTGYPGSPLADFFNILYEKKSELAGKGIKVVLANSEAHAAAMASGAKMAGQNVLIGMKSMGLHVASDALSVGNFANPGQVDDQGKKAGVVIAVGDDPWSISTSTPADSRYLFKHLHIPFLEPATPQELKDWMAKALELSQQSSVYVGVILTTFLAEGGGRVEVGSEKVLNNKLVNLEPKKFNLSENVMVPPNSLQADIKMINQRFPKMQEVLQKLGLDKKWESRDSKIGLISSGATFEVLKQCLEENNLLGNVNLYKVGASYPLIEESITSFISNLTHLIVVEEKRGFLESELRSLAQKNHQTCEILGKKFFDREGFPAFGGLNVEIIKKKLNDAFEEISTHQGHCPKSLELINPKFSALDLPKRLPTFCPGCPHRETLSLLKDLRATLNKKNINLISHGDVGCYSLSFLEPFKEMHDLSAMGQGGALGAGTDIFTENPSIVLMGDSTFFHSGMTSISNSVQLGHNITYILLDNDNTAMTGHQMTPVSGVSVEGVARPRQKMMEIVRAMQVSEVIEVNPSDRYFYKNLLQDYVAKKGVKVIVSNKECGLTFHGRQKKEERVLLKDGKTIPSKTFYQINTFACEDCRECVESTGCPGLSQTQDAYGTKVFIDPQICVSDSYCTKIKACPSFEMVEVINYHPSKYKTSQNLVVNQNDIPMPIIKKSLADIAKGDDFRMVVIGVGGSGVTTISRVLAEASLEMNNRTDLDFKFVDQKGLAQRNGSVTSHLSIFSKGNSRSQVTALASADLVVSPDLLEGARGLEYLKENGLLIVDDEFQVPLTLLLDRGIESDPLTRSELKQKLADKLKDQLIIGPFKERSFNQFNKSVYASSMILGVAFQSGHLPFEYSNLKKAISVAVPKAEIETNLKAFEIGRKWYLEKDQIKNDSLKKEFNLSDYKISLTQSLYPWQSVERIVGRFENEHKRFCLKFADLVSEENIAQYLHDLMVYDQGKTLEPFYTESLELRSILSKEHFPLAMATLAKTYFVKDEVFVAHALSSHLKLKRDINYFGELGSEFKITHINRPHFDILGFKIEFDINAKDWMLKFMKHARFLRGLLPKWHLKERTIAKNIRQKMLIELPNLDSAQQWKLIKRLNAVKGYREIRYQKADEYLV